MSRPVPRLFRGFRDIFSQDLPLKEKMIRTVREVYERYGYMPLETPAIEFVDVLGKFLPESDTPEGGIFSWRNPDLEGRIEPSNPDSWLALRYDLTAPLARVAAQYNELVKPYRRYQIGTVYRYEKPGPGRFREFTQFDFDAVGVPNVSADAEACCVMADVMTALGFARGDFIINVNDRRILQGLLECCGLPDIDIGAEETQAATVLRAVDKLDRLGIEGVRDLLGKGRKDESGDYTEGAKLEPTQIQRVEEYLLSKAESRSGTCDRLFELVKDSEVGREGSDALRQMNEFLDRVGYGEDLITFDPTIVRGLGYYTGPVFEGILKKEIRDQKGVLREFGSIYGGGRYDSLIERFTGQKIPATGASVGVDRLLEAVRLLQAEPQRPSTADVLVTVIERDRMADYFELAHRLREAGIKSELYLGSGGIGKQFRYADKLGFRLVVVAGGDEFARGEYQIKDLQLGSEMSETVKSREEWRKGRPAQQAVKAPDLIPTLQRMIREAAEEG